MKIKIDFRLQDISLELHAIEDHLDLIEKQIENIQKSEKLALDAKNLTIDDSEWDTAHQTYDHLIEFLLPRFLRGPLLVSLYAVYESAVIEISRLIQRKQGKGISIDDLKGDFLHRAKTYYKHILQFELCADNSMWEKIIMLSEVRNAIAHTNGRMEMLRERARKRIRGWQEKHIGIGEYWGYIIFDAAFANGIFAAVRVSLEDLIVRYKKWDHP